MAGLVSASVPSKSKRTHGRPESGGTTTGAAADAGVPAVTGAGVPEADAREAPTPSSASSSSATESTAAVAPASSNSGRGVEPKCLPAQAMPLARAPSTPYVRPPTMATSSAGASTRSLAQSSGPSARSVLMPCATGLSTAERFSTAARGLPGTFTTSVRPSVPAVARESQA